MAISDFLGPSLEIGSTLLKGGAQISRGYAEQAIAKRRQAADEFEAKQQEQSAEESVGAGMRNAQDEVLRAKYVNSLALARAAASGAGASDPTVMAVLSKTAGEGAYRSALAMYEGEAQARLDRMKATALRYEGETSVQDAAAAQRAENIGALGTFLTGGVKTISMFDKYWSGPSGG